MNETERLSGGAALEVRLETSFLGLDPLREAWDEAVAESGGSICMSYDWSKTWWEFYGADKQLRIFLFYSDSKLVGVVPIYSDCIGFKPLQLTVARLVCANIPPKAFKVPVRFAWAETAFQAILRQLLEVDRCDLISIGPVSESGDLLEAFECAARKNARCTQVSKSNEGVHTMFHLPETLDEFFDAMDKDERKKRRYELRLLGKEPFISKDVIRAPADVEAEFEDFVRLHALQWRDKGKLGHFGSWPRGGEYNLALVRSLGRLGRVRFVRVLSGKEVISSQYAFVFGDTCYWELPARAVERQWNRFSLGTSGFFSLVEEAIKEGYSHIEGGIAHYDYKRKLGGTEHPLRTLRVVANLPGGKLRTRMYEWLRTFLRLGYYKFWYKRIAPRLPAVFRRPVWAFWLRLDY